ncbi:MAG: type I DNA topoisomerase, partial [Gammaproteobacteria bacterium]|nr:type I DNA topoisomerase [Gammaproteobacteria bacterium]
LVHSGGRGVDVNNGFSPEWEQDERGERQMNAIHKAAQNAEKIYLATDPDREGEAISWHILELLAERNILHNKPVYRVVFYEVTKRAIQQALDEPREVSHALVEAYLARRILDYLLGYNLSPELWKKIKRGLSAGRVQSPALRLVCDREKEITGFVPREYWSIEVDLKGGDPLSEFTAKLVRLEGEKVGQFTVTGESAATTIRDRLEREAAGSLKVISVEEKPRRRNPSAPFTTSTLQQEASRKLGFGARRTMRVAQQLYEGVDFEGSSDGLITYMRTDSVNIAAEAVSEIRELISQRYGVDNLPKSTNLYKSKARNAQEAHEAIRPTSAMRIPAQVKRALGADHYRLYELVWQRAVASQMIPATLRQVTVQFSNQSSDQDVFRATGSRVVDPGFMNVYQEGRDEEDNEENTVLPSLTEGEKVSLNGIRAEQHFTEPKARYSEATLVRELEARGIGRPSTYASILSTLVDREYALLERRRFLPTAMGFAVNAFLTENFETFVDYEFTATMEEDLDRIASGEADRSTVIETFWTRLQELLGQDNEKPVFVLGKDPASDDEISWRVGPYGPYVQRGEETPAGKPVRKTLPPSWSAPALTLEKALWLLSLPRVMGKSEEGDITLETGRFGLYLKCGTRTAALPADVDPFVLATEQAIEILDNASRLPRELGLGSDGEVVTVAIGRFGPYVRCGSTFASLTKEDDPYSIELDRGRELIEKKRESDAKRTITTFSDGIKIMRGRWGPEVIEGKVRVRLPKDQDPEKLSEDDCRRILAEAPARRSGRKKTKKKVTSKKKKVSKRKMVKKKSKTSAGKKSTVKATKKTSPTVGTPNDGEVG